MKAKDKLMKLALTVFFAGTQLCFTANAGELIKAQLEPAEGWSPAGIAFLPVKYLEWPGPNNDVKGLELALIGCHNHEIAGLAFASCCAWTDGDLNGLCVAGLCTWTDGASFGVHFASVANYTEDSLNGVQLSMFNSAYAMHGLQLGMVNCASESDGIQCGLWNMTENGNGLQLGLVNLAMNFRGLQLGLGNIIGSSPLTACIIANAWF